MMYYLRQDDAILRAILHCIQTGREPDEESHEYESHEQYFKSEDDMVALFSAYLEAMKIP